MEQQRRRGRPPRKAGEPEIARVEFRIRPVARDAMRQAAESRGMALGAWLKEAAEEKLERELPLDRRPGPQAAATPARKGKA